MEARNSRVDQLKPHAQQPILVGDSVEGEAEVGILRGFCWGRVATTSRSGYSWAASTSNAAAILTIVFRCGRDLRESIFDTADCAADSIRKFFRRDVLLLQDRFQPIRESRRLRILLIQSVGNVESIAAMPLFRIQVQSVSDHCERPAGNTYP